MALILNIAMQEWSDFLKLRDFRGNHLPFSSIHSMFAVSALYLAIIYYGPRYMAGRPAFQLKRPIMLYNLLQVVVNFGLFGHSVYELANDPTPYVWQCAAPNNDATTYYARMEFASVYAYHCVKVLDLLDTVFFVLRKKCNQMSFLHVYHHLAVMWGTWLAVNFHPGGHFTFLGLLNAAVHGVMYAYYFASIYRPEVKGSLAIKKLVTLTQMAQFAVLIVHSGWPLVSSMPCVTHRFLLMLCTIQNVFMMCMFGDFYVRAYVLGPRRKAQ